MLGRVHARAAVLTHPPEGEGSEDGDRLIGGGAGAKGLEDVGPNDGIAVECSVFRTGKLKDAKEHGDFSGFEDAVELVDEFLDAGVPRGMNVAELSQEFVAFLDVGLFQCAGFQAESQGVRVGWDADGGNLKQFLLKITPSDRRGGRGGGRGRWILPANGNEAN